MGKREFEEALERAYEAVMDHGWPTMDDLKTIDEAIGYVDLHKMNKELAKSYILGIDAGYALGDGSAYISWCWDDED